MLTNSSTFNRLVYDSSPATETSQNSLNSELLSWSDFKHHDFESQHQIAEEVVQKVNHILDSRCSSRRKEYLNLRARRSHRKKSFHIGPR